MGIQVKCSGPGLIFTALLCLILPVDWMAAALTAGAFHEFCHIVAVRLTGGRIFDLKISPAGAVMEVDSTEPWQELICALAGPAGSFSLLLLAEHFSKIALCGMIQGLYNLLPIYPLDGGRILYSGMQLFCPFEIAKKICLYVQWVTVVLIVWCGLWASLKLECGLMPIFVSIFLLVRTMEGKIPCKQ